MSSSLRGLWDSISSFLGSYVYQCLPTVVRLMIVVGFASLEQGVGRFSGRKRAPTDEFVLNPRQASAVIEFCDQQKTGESYIALTPMIY
jgi:hypothetical protein